MGEFFRYIWKIHYLQLELVMQGGTCDCVIGKQLGFYISEKCYLDNIGDETNLYLFPR